MIERFKRIVRRHWPHLRLRTILLLTFVFVAALPGIGALFLRVYENTLVRQTEAELVAQGAALSAAASAQSPGGIGAVPGGYIPEPTAIDLRLSEILPERPAPRPGAGLPDPGALEWAARLEPVLRQTTRTTLASIQLLDDHGRLLNGPAGLSFDTVAEVQSALKGVPDTVLRRNGDYHPRYSFEWLSRASDLRIHHARPIFSGGRVVGVLLLSRSPRALFVGIYEDRGKIALGVALIFAALVVLSGLLSRGIVRPVEQLSEATRAVASGGGVIPDPPATAAIEIQALYRDFGAMADAIERRSRYLRDFAHAMSHEFKTPLAGISGAVELLQDHPEMGADDRRRFLGNMAEDAARLTRLISRLLDLARADMGETDAAAVSDLTTTLRRVADAYRGGALGITLDARTPLPPVRVPEAVIEAVATALIENSRQAAAGQVWLDVSTNTDTITLIVRDDGPGIAAGDRDRIFEPFFTSHRAAGGTGLGLPIVRSLLQAYRATITLEHAPEGAAFSIRLPVA